MTQKIGRKKTMESRNDILKLDDVYDIAGKVSQEFNILINNYGHEPLEQLMNLMMVALQHLEQEIIDKDRQENKISDLKMHIAQLESYKDGRMECQQKFEKELEQIEEQWRWEKSQLADKVKELEEENRKLRQAVSSARDAPETCEHCANQADTTTMVQSMKNSMERLQHQLEQRDQKLRNTSEALETYGAQAQTQLEQLSTLLRDQVRQLQKQVHTLQEEKSFLQVQLASTMALDKFLASAASSSPQQVAPAFYLPSACYSPVPFFSLDGDGDDVEAFVPVSEMKKLMWEREDLLCQVRDLKDELTSFQSAPSDPNISLSSLSSSLSNATTSSSIDLPVEGPINREPYEKLYPGRKRSRIQKFFHLGAGGE